MNSQQVYQLTLGYDNVGRISTKTEVVSGTSHVSDYTYDLDGQLFQVRKDGVFVEQYGYDNNANRTSTLSTTATYDEQDRLIQQGGVNYIFDADGFLWNRGSDTFAYSARGELLSATVGGQTTTYQYDGIARRIARTDAAGVMQYLYGNPGNPFQVTATRDAAGVLTTYFFDTAGNLFALERGGVWYYVATDQLGTPKAVTDSAGVVVKSVEYDAWGVKASDSNPAFDLPIGFAGGIADGGTGLVRFGYRDYELGTGRWTARDPLGLGSDDTNLYAYARNNPVNNIDSDGLWCFNFEKFAKQVEANRFDLGATLGTLFATEAFGTMPKTPSELRGFGVPRSELNPYTGQLSRWSSRLGIRSLRDIGRTAAGRVLGATATAALVFEGFYDWGVIGMAAWDATSSGVCDGCPGK